MSTSRQWHAGGKQLSVCVYGQDVTIRRGVALVVDQRPWSDAVTWAQTTRHLRADGGALRAELINFIKSQITC
jgi:hypothetical protein